jgi:hypothetical protein
MNRIDRPAWTRRVRAALSGLTGIQLIELLANLAWLG